MIAKSVCNLPLRAILLDALPATGLVRIPLAVTGTWARGEVEFSITREDLDVLSANFSKRKHGEINVDYEHASEMPEVAAGGPIPSAGRIVKLDSPEAFNGTGQQILWGWYEPTDRARELIANREYRYISPAIDWGAHDKSTGKRQGTTLTSIALTNRPFLEELPALRLSEIASQDRRLRADTGEPARREQAMGRKTETAKRDELARRARERAKEKGIPLPFALGEVAREDPKLALEAREEVLGLKLEPRTLDNGRVIVDFDSAEQLANLAHARASEKNISYRMALCEVSRENPALAQRYRAQILCID